MIEIRAIHLGMCTRIVTESGFAAERYPDLDSARARIAELSAKRRASRRPDGSYSPIVHGIRRNRAAANTQ